MKSHTKELKEIWEQVPPNYYQQGVRKNTLQRIWHTNKLRAVHYLMNLYPRPNKILDVGCASGWFLYELSKRFRTAQYFGVDVYAQAIRYGKKRYPSLKLTNADAHMLPYSDKSFDIVVCTEVLEHVEHPKNVIREIKRVLKDDGVGIIEMDTGNFLFRVVWYWWTTIRNGVWKDSHIHVFTTQKLETMLKEAGFLITNKRFFNWYMAVAFAIEKKSKLRHANRLK